MEKLKGSVFITSKDIQNLTDKTYKSANKEHLAIRDALGKKENRLTVKEYCKFYNLNYNEIVESLNEYR